jgi:hypothetical protein
MSNMSYCRFHNTLSDLRDCYEHIHDKLPESREWDGGEKAARQSLIELCLLIVNEECEVDDETGEITVHEYDDEECED